MKLKILVVTSYRWSSRIKKHNAIIKLMKPLNVSIDTLYVYLGKPEIKNGRITEEWFETNISEYAKSKGYTNAIFQFSMEDGRRWKLKSGLRGSNFKDGDFFGESWVRCNENSIVRFKDGSKRDKYTKVIPHEVGHELKNQGYTKLEIHDYDFGNTINNLEGFYQDLVVKVSRFKFVTLSRMLDLLKIAYSKLQLQPKNQVYKPVEEYWDMISQSYGVKSTLYKLTGHHIGVDLACPVGTKIKARVDGEVTHVGKSDVLGYYCHFKFGTYTERYLHQNKMPVTGKFKAGETIGITGNTGMTTGPHLHLETWVNEVQLELINKNNWSTMTVDPHLIK